MARYIEADALIHTIHDEWDEVLVWDESGRTTADEFERLVDSAPTEDVAPIKRGYWIGKPIAGYTTVRCSNCKEAFSENNGRWLYCPHCGAIMDGKEEEK